jgi:HD-GYP domain-containing protein (c-di-GMP phosphodiesterase class II)
MGSAVIGVINANNKTSGEAFTGDDLTMLISLSERLSKVIERMRMAEDFHAFLRETTESLRTLLLSQERGGSGLTKKMERWAVGIARKLGLGEKEIHVIQFVSSVHDVGMTCINEEILNKTLALTPEEIDEIRKHPQQGTAIIRPLEFVELVSQNILFHHERMDGKGYPMGLMGEQIPIGSRILAVLDAYVSMISDKPFRQRMSVNEAVDELVRHTGSQFDPRVVSAFIEVMVDEGEVEVEDFTRISDGLRSVGKHHIMP